MFDGSSKAEEEEAEDGGACEVASDEMALLAGTVPAVVDVAVAGSV